METNTNSRFKFTFIILGIIVVLGILWMLVSINNKPKNKILTPEQREALLQELSKTVVPVTPQQKEALLKNLSKNSAQSVTLTQEQKDALLTSLNNQ